jgi:Ran GTPase-activating protein (RanGAP) involved in mRNA processing and transport
VLGAQHLAAGLANAYGHADRTAAAPSSLGKPPQPANTPHLCILQLSGNALGPTGLQQLLAGLAAAQAEAAAGTSLLEHLQVLDLGCNALGDAGAAALAQYCEQLSSLQLLGLSGNGIGTDGARALFGCMSSSSSSSSGRKTGSKTGAANSSTEIAGQPRWLPALRVLQLGGNFLGDAGASALAAALPELRQLRQLQLQDNYSIGKGP